jgi:hypothetical protein
MISKNVHWILATIVGVIIMGSTLSSTILFANGKIDGDISCSPQGDGKTYCCADILDKNGYTSTTYCTMCDDTKPPSNCTKRERPMTVTNPGLLSNILEGEGPGKTSVEGQRANISTLTGGILQEDNNLTIAQIGITNNNDSNDTLLQDQSDLVSDTVKKPARTADDDAEGQTSEEPSDELTDQTINDKKSVD